MQLARVVGQAVSTVKHASLKGWKLLLVQPLSPNGKDDGEPLLAINIATPTGEGLTTPLTFTRERRTSTVGSMRVL